jgi:hypothetical protein
MDEGLKKQALEWFDKEGDRDSGRCRVAEEGIEGKFVLSSTD